MTLARILSEYWFKRPDLLRTRSQCTVFWLDEAGFTRQSVGPTIEFEFEFEFVDGGTDVHVEVGGGGGALDIIHGLYG